MGDSEALGRDMSLPHVIGRVLDGLFERPQEVASKGPSPPHVDFPTQEQLKTILAILKK